MFKVRASRLLLIEGEADGQLRASCMTANNTTVLQEQCVPIYRLFKRHVRLSCSSASI